MHEYGGETQEISKLAYQKTCDAPCKTIPLRNLRSRVSPAFPTAIVNPETSQDARMRVRACEFLTPTCPLQKVHSVV